jgi:hypothetical protein
MQRLIVVTMVLAGIALSGALGGHVMRQAGRTPRVRVDAPRPQHRVVIEIAGAASASRD